MAEVIQSQVKRSGQHKPLDHNRSDTVTSKTVRPVYKPLDHDRSETVRPVYKQLDHDISDTLTSETVRPVGLYKPLAVVRSLHK